MFLFWNLVIWISTLYGFTTTTKRRTFYVPFPANALFIIYTLCWAFAWRGRSSVLHNTGSISGLMLTSVASHPYRSESGLMTAGVEACNHILHCRYVCFMCSCIVVGHYTSWAKSSSFLELWYCSRRYSLIQAQGTFQHSGTHAIYGASRERSMDAFKPNNFGSILLVLSQQLRARMVGRPNTKHLSS